MIEQIVWIKILVLRHILNLIELLEEKTFYPVFAKGLLSVY